MQWLTDKQTVMYCFAHTLTRFSLRETKVFRFTFNTSSSSTIPMLYTLFPVEGEFAGPEFVSNDTLSVVPVSDACKLTAHILGVKFQANVFLNDTRRLRVTGDSRALLCRKSLMSPDLTPFAIQSSVNIGTRPASSFTDSNPYTVTEELTTYGASDAVALIFSVTSLGWTVLSFIFPTTPIVSRFFRFSPPATNHAAGYISLPNLQS